MAKSAILVRGAKTELRSLLSFPRPAFAPDLNVCNLRKKREIFEIIFLEKTNPNIILIFRSKSED